MRETKSSASVVGVRARVRRMVGVCGGAKLASVSGEGSELCGSRTE